MGYQRITIDGKPVLIPLDIVSFGGPQGINGTQGIQGVQGTQGIDGAQGAQGAQGLTGAGVQGAQGATGSQGVQGEIGLTGAGVQGAQGTSGTTGLQFQYVASFPETGILDTIYVINDSSSEWYLLHAHYVPSIGWLEF